MIDLRLGDCHDILPMLESDSIDACVTDPPYELGFMGKRWDASGIAYNVEMWAQVLRVLRPGAYLLAFGGTRTYHRMVCAIEDAGFEIRDSIDWVYGSGFPKSLDVSLAIDRAACLEALVAKLGRGPTKEEFKAAWKEWRNVIGLSCKHGGGAKVFENQGDIGFATNGKPDITAPATDAAREWSGWGTALKPAHEPIVVARKPLSESTVAANVLRWGTGAINVDASRIGIDCQDDSLRIRNNTKTIGGNGKYGGGVAIGTSSSPQGRFPANLITDGSAEVVAMFPQTTSGARNGPNPNATRALADAYEGGWKQTGGPCEASTGSAARFFKSCPLDEDDYPPLFYCAKASKAERDAGCEELDEKRAGVGCDRPSGDFNQRLKPHGRENIQPVKSRNHHPTVKPLSLMRYLITLCTREGATVLDPFCGSGSTLVACVQLGRNGIGCDNNAEYIEIAKRRIDAAMPVAIELPLKVEA